MYFFTVEWSGRAMWANSCRGSAPRAFLSIPIDLGHLATPIKFIAKNIIDASDVRTSHLWAQSEALSHYTPLAGHSDAEWQNFTLQLVIVMDITILY